MRPKLILPPLYNIWVGLFYRCYDTKSTSYKNYGGRGIKVCKRWHNYLNFLADMGERPVGKSLDRTNNDKGYNPKNCRWATRKEQQRNKRDTVRLIIEGKEYVAADLADIAGKKVDTIIKRARRGLPYKEVIAMNKFIFNKYHKDGRANATHCKYGHEYTPENTNITPQGWRGCRTCARLKTQRQRNQRKATKLIIEGKEYLAGDLAELANKKVSTIIVRAKKGFTYAAVTTRGYAREQGRYKRPGALLGKA